MNILIVEDESLVALGLANTVADLGHHVVDYATNISMAKEAVRKNPVDLIIMDINLNDAQNGIEFYQSLHVDMICQHFIGHRIISV